jgi:SEC-C motif domain protein
LSRKQSHRRPSKQQTRCPCGSGADFGACCGPFIARNDQPRTAEQLMRSRYTAYSLCDADWLTDTWHPATRRPDVVIDPSIKWTRLEIVATEAGGPDDTRGIVEFIAYYKVRGRAQRLHERSRFQRSDGQWHYVAGDLAPDTTADDDNRGQIRAPGPSDSNGVDR